MVSGIEVFFPGDQVEANDLLAALEHNCSCERNDQGVTTKTCGGHQALAHDQRFVSGLVFVKRSLLRRIHREEWCIDD